MDSEVLRIIGESHEEARRLLTEHHGELDGLARTLLERESLDEEEILGVTGLPPAPLWKARRFLFPKPTPTRRRETQGAPRVVFQCPMRSGQSLYS